MQVVSTKMYSKFNYLKYNRPINEGLVKKLIASIQFKNLLHHKPILVDKDFNVIDGQHRLEAAKELNLPIYYTTREDQEKPKIGELVALQVSGRWSLEDFLHAHVQSGNKEYIKLENIMVNHNISLTQALIFQELEIGDRSKLDGFKKGTMKVKNIDQIDDMLDKLNQVITYIKEKDMSGFGLTWVSSKTFSKAFLQLLENPDFDFDLFMTKLPYKVASLHPCVNLRETYAMLATVYNHRNSNPIDTIYAPA